ncbi:MAG: glycine--tRNA ligase subunit beta [Deltaproteobacteria bacterium]|nr:glycine--tRNA ligase subunit beta [Deltaproteobacteria bacterium]
MPKDLIFEIGTEEIPAGFIPKALNSLEAILKKNLEASRIGFDEVRTLGTPRRLSLIIKNLSDKQPDISTEVKGPQLKAAFDANGNPTNALLGFVKSQGVDIKNLKTVKTEKGEWVYFDKFVKGGETSAILPEILKNTISQDFFSKSMRWNVYDVSFARPVHWILALYGGKPVDVSYGPVKSAPYTYGHRFLAEKDPATSRLKPIEVTGVESYIENLRAAYVIPDPEERKKIIIKGLEASAREVGGTLVPDDNLLEEVTYLVEYPVVLRGSFSEEFLKIPRDVVTNAMREHQRYFTIIDSKGGLMPYFLTVANTLAKDMDVVRKGNERVLRARLNDAKFYYELDVKKKLVDRVENLKGVVFQAKLGTSYEKVERFTELAVYIGSKVGFSKPLEEGEKASDFLSDSFNPAAFDSKNTDPGLYSKFVVGRAAILAKADLTSGVVGEFPKLQGIMGSVYAKKSGEADEVAVAIYEHYLPNVSGGALPASLPGAIVSIADKTDTIAGCFSVGLIPTGAQDPYALRRQALGIIATILDKSLSLRLNELVDEAIRLVGKKATRDKAEIKSNILEFFKERLKNQLLTQGLSFDSIDAVLSAPWFDIVDAVNRVKALEGFKKHPACPSLVTAFKRVSNILKGADFEGKRPQEALFKEAEEAALYKVSSEIAPLIEGYWAKGDYEKVFETLASIKDKIDAFFDKVMVMAEDADIRQNRLILLDSIRSLYFKIADLSKLVV